MFSTSLKVTASRALRQIAKRCMSIAPTDSIARVTALLHAGFDPMRSEGAVSVPIILPSTYAFSSAQAGKIAFEKATKGEKDGELLYTRVNHPCAEIVENRLTAFEPNAGDSALFCSGMSAITTTVMSLLPRDKRLVFTTPLYGGSQHFFTGALRDRWHYDVVAVNPLDPKSCEKAIKESATKLGMLFMETPANPTLAMTDIALFASWAKQANPECVVAVDNTFMGVFQQPFALSKDIDIILYSATKFLGGHSQLIGGVSMCRKGKEEMFKQVRGMRVAFGNILYPFEAWQLSTSICTYDLRMRKEAENATQVAAFLASHPRIERTLHPSLLKPGDRDYPIYKKQCSGPGSMISFYLKDAQEADAFRFLDLCGKDHLISLAVSLGGVDSLIEHPMAMTHHDFSPEEMAIAQIKPNLIRLSVGLEAPADIIRCLHKALDGF